MAVYQILLDPKLQDLNPILVGSATASFENSRPSNMNHFTLIHFVDAGKGFLELNGNTYPVHAGQAFIIPFGTHAYHEADAEDPWAYRWVGVTGTLAHKFDELPPVFDIPEEILPILCQPTDPQFSVESLGYRLSAELMFLYSLLVKPSNGKIDYIQKIKDHVQMFYADKLSIENLAASLGLSRSYLTDQFRKQTGYSIRQYILTTRIQAAKRHLMDGCSVKEAAILCGINDLSNFTKLFTRETGKSPTEWMSWVKGNTDEFIKELNSIDKVTP